MSMVEAGAGAHADPHLQHHFEDMAQQYESGKLGMWLFLVTEILLFSGLFCAYAVYRHNHPEIFEYADRFLDRRLGALNTLVLIFSSFTMALAVRSAQLGRTRSLVRLLSVTLVCAFVFLGIKGVEYEQKWKHGLLWGTHYTHGRTEAVAETPATEAAAPTTDAGAVTDAAQDAAAAPASPAAPANPDATTLPPPARGPAGLAAARSAEAPGGAEGGEHGPAPRNVQIFFGIYFVMTGLHGLHVVAGMIVIMWLIGRARTGEFGPAYFAPVDFAGLYWHLVDLIWIFLFPLLYLIH